MTNNQIYDSIVVYSNQSGQFLIWDDSQIAIRDPNQYFNLHTGVIESIEPETISNKYQVIIGENKTSACDIYLHWKWTRKTLYVVNKAWDKFPINGCYKPPAEITRAINSKKNEKINRTSSPQIEILPVRPRDSTVERTQRIREFVKNQEIQFLCHFTHIENLASILDHGLITRSEIDLRSNNIKIHINDKKRLDGYRNSISLSISYPNYQMFYKFNQHNQNKWVVICLKPNILWELDCAFYPENAARYRENKRNLKKLKEAESLENMFKDFGTKKRLDLNIPKKYTTNPQAEVLVFGNIPLNYFLNICFFNENAKLSWLDSNSTNKEGLIIVTNKCFSARKDYKFWKKKNDGINDSEINYDDEIPF